MSTALARLKPGEVYRGESRDATGHEQKYPRPMAVVSIEKANGGEIIVCVPLTSQKSKHDRTLPSWNVRIPASEIKPVSTAPPIPRDSIALCDQITACTRERLHQLWAHLTPDALEAIRIGIQRVLGL
ncbi:type II toxin-antitoxin system PemK/MazF family toxin [Terriglobus sp. TAA 43]|uniref:type II toxin-antitoxin system PemK/MazF family toxin n=1 Tax=Terriglobus sp. TAA 43 TaxID=278961 RepID=UPI000A0461B8